MKRFKERAQAAEYIDTLSISQIRELLIDFLTQEEATALKKISITQEQFRAYFKLTGVTESGEVERRGRPRKESTL